MFYYFIFHIVIISDFAQSTMYRPIGTKLWNALFCNNMYISICLESLQANGISLLATRFGHRQKQNMVSFSNLADRHTAFCPHGSWSVKKSILSLWKSHQRSPKLSRQELSIGCGSKHGGYQHIPIGWLASKSLTLFLASQPSSIPLSLQGSPLHDCFSNLRKEWLVKLHYLLQLIPMPAVQDGQVYCCDPCFSILRRFQDGISLFIPKQNRLVRSCSDCGSSHISHSVANRTHTLTCRAFT